MQIEELARLYGEDAIDRIAVSKLFSPLDCSDIKSNAYEFKFGEDPDTIESYVLHFDKFMSEWTPFVDEEIVDEPEITAEGEEPPVARPYLVAKSVANYIYDEFTDNIDVATYHKASVDGLREVAETYRKHVEMEPEVFVVDEDLLDGGTIMGIEAIEGVDVYQSEYLDLGREVLVSNTQVGYSATRTPIDVGYYTSGDGEPTKENPYVVQCYTRRDVVKVRPEYAMKFTPVSPNRKV